MGIDSAGEVPLYIMYFVQIIWVTVSDPFGFSWVTVSDTPLVFHTFHTTSSNTRL
jgi:hypothetical protein